MPLLITLFICCLITALKSQGADYRLAVTPLGSPAADRYASLKKLGFQGGLLIDEEFNAHTQLRPVPLPGLILDELPPEDLLDSNKLSSISAQWPVLEGFDRRQALHEMIKKGVVVVLSENMCDEKAVTMGEPHPVLARWSSVLKRKISIGLVLSRCLSDFSFWHEFYHVIQYENYDDYLSFTDSTIAHLVIKPKDSWLDTFHQAIIEIQATIYGIKTARRLRTANKIEVDISERAWQGEVFALQYLADHYRRLLVAINSLVKGDLQKQKKVLNAVAQFLPLDGDNFYTSSLGWNQFICESEKGWIAIPGNPVKFAGAIATRSCKVPDEL